MTRFSIPDGAKKLLLTLNGGGYDAYLVGGCIRDSLIGKTPKDWDICTSAKPEEIKTCLSHIGVRSIDTGLKHGTVTADMGENGKNEITTFRIDGEYTDHRHPDSVSFIDDICEDLSLRDFTINAIALRVDCLLADPFHGVDDLRDGIIRCVGNPDDRFQEDPLRVLRALRFAATYDFKIEERTEAAIHENAWRLCDISVERIRDELCKILLADGVLEILLDFPDVICTIIPEMKPCVGFDQDNKYHQYTVYEHIAHAVANYGGNDLSVLVALLLHDIGKPQCYTRDENGGHFHGHAVPSRDLAEQVLERLKFDNKSKKEILELVLYHDSQIEPTQKTIRRWLNKLGPEHVEQLFSMKVADILAHALGTQAERIRKVKYCQELLKEMLRMKQCFSLKDLRINGSDVMALGVPQGKLVGDILNALLQEVISGTVPNDRDALLEIAKEYAEANR